MTFQTPAVALAFLCACACLPRVAQADAASDAQAAIQGVYARQNAAYLREDIAGIAATYAPGFIQYNQCTGETKNEGQALDTGLTFALFRPISSETTLLKVTVHGSQAVVMCKSHIVLAALETNNAGVHSVHTRLVGDALSLDTWVNSGTGWLEQRVEFIGGSVGVGSPVASPQTDSAKGTAAKPK